MRLICWMVPAAVAAALIVFPPRVSAQARVQAEAEVHVAAPRAPQVQVARPVQPARGGFQLQRATRERGTGWGVNVAFVLGGGLGISEDVAVGARRHRGSFVIGGSVGFPIGLVFEPHIGALFTLADAGLAPTSGESRGPFTTSLLMGGVRLKLDPWINLYVDGDIGWGFNEIGAGYDNPLSVDNGGIAHAGLGYRFFTNCESQDAAVELGVHAQYGLGSNRVNDAIFATIGVQLDIAGMRRYSFTGSCQRSIAQREEDEREAAERAEYARLHPPVVPVAAPAAPIPVVAVGQTAPATTQVAGVRANEPAQRVPSGPPSVGVVVRPYMLIGSSLADQGSIEAPHFRGGAGIGLGVAMSKWFDLRADFDFVGQGDPMMESAKLSTFSLVGRLRFDPVAPFYIDLGLAYGIAGSTPIDDVTSGGVARAGAGFRYITGCNCNASLTLDIGVEGRFAIGDNRIADGLFFTVGIPITFGRSFADESATCRARAEANVERARERDDENRRLRAALEAEARARRVSVQVIIDERHAAEMERERVNAQQAEAERQARPERDARARAALNTLGGAVDTAAGVARGGTVDVRVEGRAEAREPVIIHVDGYVSFAANGSVALHPEVLPLAQLQRASRVDVRVEGTSAQGRTAGGELIAYLRAHGVAVGWQRLTPSAGPVRIELTLH
ncbi:MAG: hypothetical protein IPK60_22490 [Sandaracinaceae bacterium]|nr:hypothetical protein [Sandaracinaceae bacterium]